MLSGVMRTPLTSVCLTLVLAGQARAQVISSTTGSVGMPLEFEGIVIPLSLRDQAATPSPPPSQQRRLSTTQKGAIIGAATGAVFGIVVGNLLCDGSHCDISGYARGAAVFALPGAGIGALIGHLVGEAHKASGSPSRTTVSSR